MANETFTQEQVEQLLKEKADASFKAGQKKAREEKAKAAQESNFEAQKARLEELEGQETIRLQEKELNETIAFLKTDAMNDTGLKVAGLKRFANENKEQLKGLSGEALSAKVKEIRESINEDDENLFFDNAEVQASSSLVGGEFNEENNGDEYYPGSSIRKRK